MLEVTKHTEKTNGHWQTISKDLSIQGVRLSKFLRKIIIASHFKRMLDCRVCTPQGIYIYFVEEAGHVGPDDFFGQCLYQQSVFKEIHAFAGRQNHLGFWPEDLSIYLSICLFMHPCLVQYVLFVFHQLSECVLFAHMIRRSGIADSVSPGALVKDPGAGFTTLATVDTWNRQHRPWVIRKHCTNPVLRAIGFSPRLCQDRRNMLPVKKNNSAFWGESWQPPLSLLILTDL